MLNRAADNLSRQLVAQAPPAIERRSTGRASLQGRVEAMERDRPTGRGWVAVRGILTTEDAAPTRSRARVWVPLQPDDYDRALRAHGQGLNVRISGNLTHTRRRTVLDPVSGFFRVLNE